MKLDRKIIRSYQDFEIDALGDNLQLILASTTYLISLEAARLMVADLMGLLQQADED